MEIGRLKLLDKIGLSIKKLEERNITPVLASTEINYKKPLYISDTVKIEVWVSKLYHASAEISFKFYNSNNEIAATGKQKGLFISLITRKPYRITAEERAGFEKMLEEEK
jgi:acyl-CoA thioester hydrolase